ncbi:MAG: type II/IV secretion system ATPase subunit [Candidatus Thermoplasmatota archaeon]
MTSDETPRKRRTGQPPAEEPGPAAGHPSVPTEAAPPSAPPAPPSMHAVPDPSGAQPKPAGGSRTTKAIEPGQKVLPGKVGPVTVQSHEKLQQAIRQVARDTARPDVVKIPRFPAATMQRPERIRLEETRRLAIAQEEGRRREADLEKATTEEQRLRLKRVWEEEDKLYYAHDPDDIEVETYPVREPYQYVQIIRNKRTHDVIYHAIEPRLTHDEHLLLDFIESTLVDVLELQPDQLDTEDWEDYIRGKFDLVIKDYSVKVGEGASEQEANDARDRLLYYVLRDFIGEGPLDILVHDSLIEDISCDGPHEPIFVYHRKYESVTTTIRYRDHAHLDSFVIRLAQRAGKHISIAEPILDATMRDGSRLQATLAKEVSTFGSTFTIRKFREIPFSPVDLVRFGTMSPSMLAYLWMVIQYHMSSIYAGGTASGKTTAINAIMMFIPPQQKVVTIEDTREIRIPQPNWIAGITRGGFGPRDANGRQAGEIDMFQLLKNALRQRPEYIIVGEVRGAEAYSLFQAMATGHAAYGTMHADSVDAVIHRLESEPINIPRSLLEALDVVCVQIQTRVGGKRVRRTKQITEIVGVDPNTREILTNEVFNWIPAADQFEYSGVSYVLERIAAEAGLAQHEVISEMQDRVRVIEYLVGTNLTDYNKIANLIATYYKEKPKVMQYVGVRRPWP